MREKVIEVTNLIKKYDEINAVDNISFDVYEGEVFAFLGPNGAGKTTTVEILEGIRSPTQGTAKVCGYDINHSSEIKEVKRIIGVLPQDYNALEKLS
ncbi:MAG: ATP-binding cassette domain-containing protein, partial [Crenarchaeota archaeon]|nr:ATP-binding cassette domain-containing protein [Thermoproteota archaeon]